MRARTAWTTALGAWGVAATLVGCAPPGDWADAVPPSAAASGRGREEAPVVGDLCPERPVEAIPPGTLRFSPDIRPYAPRPGCEGRRGGFEERRVFITGQDLTPVRR